MIANEGILALLHFSAVISVLSVAFLGFDRAHIERSNLADGLDAAKPKAQEVMLRLGLPARISIRHNGKWQVKPVFLANVICIIADNPMDLPYILAVGHFIYRQRHIPFFKYFRRNHHLLTIGILTFVACMIFSVTTAAVIWHHDWLLATYNNLPEMILFSLLFVIGAWIILTGWSGRQLKEERLTRLCKFLEEEITRHFAKKREGSTGS